MSVDRTLEEFARSIPLYLLAIVVITAFIAVVDKDRSALPFVTISVVSLAPLFWLRGQASDDGPKANPRVCHSRSDGLFSASP